MSGWNTHRCQVGTWKTRRMMRTGETLPNLFTYRITHDTGFAPNPFGGVCTLVTCKPKIRVTAQPGDCIAAVAAVSAEIGSHKNRLIYAMRVSEKMAMNEYDEITRSQLKIKVANRHSS